jgi:biotin transport system substrate-specific component
MLCGTVLGARRGALAVGLFLLLVALGLPILTGGRGGLGVFAGPSVGFLVGFPVAAFVAGLVTERARLPIGWAAAAGAFLGGIVVLYLLGAAGWALMLGKSMAEVQVFLLGFLPGDLIKVVLAGLITRSVARMRPGSLLSRPA